MSNILMLYLDFESAKIIHGLYVLISGNGGCWRYLTWSWHLLLELNMVACSIFWSSILILKVQRASMSQKSLLGLWRLLVVLDGGLVTSLLGYIQEPWLDLPLSFHYTQFSKS